MAATLESKLVVSLTDNVSGSAKAVAGSLSGIMSAVKNVEASVKSSGLKKLEQDIASLGASSPKVEALKKSFEALDKVGQLSNLQAGTKALAQNMLGAANKVSVLNQAFETSEAKSKKMAYAIERAKDAHLKATKAYEAHENAVKHAKSALEGMGLSVRNLDTQEAHLKSTIEQTTAAITKQVDAAKEAAKKRAEMYKNISNRNSFEVNNAQKAAAVREAAARKNAEIEINAAKEAVRIQAAHQEKLNAAKTAAGVAAGAAAVKGAKSALTAGADVQHERVKMEAAGMTPAERKEMEEKASVAANENHVRKDEIMRLGRTARFATGDNQHAEELVPALAQFFALEKRAGKHKDSHSALEATEGMLKAIEIKGVAQDPKEFASYMEGIAKSRNAIGESFKPSEFADAFRQTKMAGMSMSKEFVTEVLPILGQELGGKVAGTGLATLYQTNIGGKMKNVAADKFHQLGMVKDEDVVRTSTGSVKGIKAGGMMENELAKSNPFQWVNEVLMPRVIADAEKTAKTKVAGFEKLDDASKQKAVNNEAENTLATLYGNRNATDTAMRLWMQKDKLNKDITMQRGAAGLDSAKLYAEKDTHAAMGGLSDSLANFGAQLSNPIVAKIPGLLNGISNAIGSFSHYLSESPIAGGIATGVAGAAAVGGAALGAKSLMSILAAGPALLTSAKALDVAAAKLAMGGGGLPGKGGAVAGAVENVGKIGVGATVVAGAVVAGVAAIGAGIAAGVTKAATSDDAKQKYIAEMLEREESERENFSMIDTSDAMGDFKAGTMSVYAKEALEAVEKQRKNRANGVTSDKLGELAPLTSFPENDRERIKAERQKLASDIEHRDFEKNQKDEALKYRGMPEDDKRNYRTKQGIDDLQRRNANNVDVATNIPLAVNQFAPPPPPPAPTAMDTGVSALTTFFSAAADSFKSSGEGAASSLKTATDSIKSNGDGAAASITTASNTLPANGTTAGTNMGAGILASAAQWGAVAGATAKAAIGALSISGGGVPALAGARASGGPVSAGSSYLVGERGHEIFTPNTNGRIIPNHELNTSPRGSSGGGGRSAASVGGGSSTSNVTVNVNVASGNGGGPDVEAIIAKVTAEIRAKMKSTFRGTSSDVGVAA